MFVVNLLIPGEGGGWGVGGGVGGWGGGWGGGGGGGGGWEGLLQEGRVCGGAPPLGGALFMFMVNLLVPGGC
jgi:hypothetical protein